MQEEKNGVKPSRLLKILPDLSSRGFGAWALGGEYWGPQDHKNSVRALHRALALKINHFDTAPVYGKGRSEQILGQQLKKVRSSCIIATKAFYSSPEKMKSSLETSLRRLLTDYADIFYIHWPLGEEDMRPGMEMLETLRREGRIRAIGVSNFTVDQIRMVEEAGSVDVYQGGYNLLWTSPEKELIPFLREKDIAFIPYGVLGQGLLTTTGIEHLNQDHKGFRHKMILYKEELKPVLHGILEELNRSCSKAGINVEQAVSLYTRQRCGAESILLGCRNRAQAETNFAAESDEIPIELRKVMNRIAEEASSLVPLVPNLFNHKS